MNNKDSKYQTLMANLLNIDTYDTSLYTSINSENFFDIYNNFGQEIFDQIFKNYKFNCILTEVKNKEMRQLLEKAQNKQEIITIYKDNNVRIEQSIFKMLSTDFEKAKTLLITKLESEFQKSIVNWKKIINKAENINIETNIWPLHVGFLFISIKTDKKTIFAPLLFKEVTLEVKNSLVYLKSNSDVRINSKLVTFLSQEGFLLNIDNLDFSNLSIESIFEHLKRIWSPIYNMPQSLRSNIPLVSQSDIQNVSIEFHPGMIFGFYNVSSGYLWNQMKKIIENDEFESILVPEINKNVYREKINTSIFNNKFKLFKVQKTNFSQDVATVSALCQDTIIWGPPGTGKSQTISNIIVNIIARGYTALVVSQKKAALDVLRNRLGQLSLFCLFALNDKNLRQEVFYEPLKKFIEKIENFSISQVEKGIQIFSDEDKGYVDTLNEIEALPNLNNLLHFYASTLNANLTINDFNTLRLLAKDIKYDVEGHTFNDKKELKKYLYEVNLKRRPSIFSIYPRSIKEASELIINAPELFKINVDEAVKYIDKVEFAELETFVEKYKNLLIKKTIDVSNSTILSNMLFAKLINTISNFNDEQKREYTSFAMSIRTGSLKPYMFFHRYKNIIKVLFPIIVTTPELDLSMWGKEEFDYAILDESSQIFIEKGIPILYLAKRKILAGDSKQMQPTRWFSVSYNFEDEEELGDIESLLDYATARGTYSILLDKNYRSKRASLMTFSSKHFYDSKLDVIDDFKLAFSSEKPIDVIQVDGEWNNSYNEAEAKEVLRIAKENLTKYEKIIILVFNVKQQEYLTNAIFSVEPELEKALFSDKITIKNIENIQGDEADLVIMSVVYDKKTALFGTYVARKGGKNALNVAISRAREKIIVVKSIYADDVEINERSTSDMRLFKEWLKFLDLSIIEQKNYLFLDNENKKYDEKTQTILLPKVSNLQMDVLAKLNELLKELNANNFEIISNYSIGTKLLDLVLINKISNNMIIGINIDDFKYLPDYRKYLKFKDDFNFLLSKSYPIINISRISWIVENKQILNKIKILIKHEEELNSQILLSEENNNLNVEEIKENIIENNALKNIKSSQIKQSPELKEIDFENVDDETFEVNQDSNNKIYELNESEVAQFEEFHNKNINHEFNDQTESRAEYSKDYEKDFLINYNDVELDNTHIDQEFHIENEFESTINNSNAVKIEDVTSSSVNDELKVTNSNEQKISAKTASEDIESGFSIEDINKENISNLFSNTFDDLDINMASESEQQVEAKLNYDSGIVQDKLHEQNDEYFNLEENNIEEQQKNNDVQSPDETLKSQLVYIDNNKEVNDKQKSYDFAGLFADENEETSTDVKNMIDMNTAEYNQYMKNKDIEQDEQDKEITKNTADEEILNFDLIEDEKTTEFNVEDNNVKK